MTRVVPTLAIAFCALCFFGLSYFVVKTLVDHQRQLVARDFFISHSSVDHVTNSVSGVSTSTVRLFVADNNFARQKGLSDRSTLDEVEGMIFLYPVPKAVKFVMRDMYFNLDFAFVDEAGTVIKVVRNVPRDFEGQIVSERPISAVIEIPTGTPAAAYLTENATVRAIEDGAQ